MPLQLNVGKISFHYQVVYQENIHIASCINIEIPTMQLMQKVHTCTPNIRTPLTPVHEMSMCTEGLAFCA